jgi:hypothetical protein
MIPRLRRAWAALAREQRVAASCAAILFLTMFLPWYQQSAVGVNGKGQPVKAEDSLSAWQAFSFVEAAVLLVAAGVLFLLFARAEGRRFHLPGGDGTVILAGGVWVSLLIFIRQIDKPDGQHLQGLATTVGVQWGIFVAFVAGLALAWAGYRLRQAHLAEPPLPGEAPTRRAPRPPREPRPPAREPDADREPRVRRGPLADPHAAATEVAPTSSPPASPRRDRPVVDGGEQLSFDEQE